MSYRSMAADDLVISVDGVGRLGFPISGRTAGKLRKVARPAPFGLRDRTRPCTPTPPHTPRPSAPRSAPPPKNTHPRSRHRPARQWPRPRSTAWPASAADRRPPPKVHPSPPGPRSMTSTRQRVRRGIRVSGWHDPYVRVYGATPGQLTSSGGIDGSTRIPPVQPGGSLVERVSWTTFEVRGGERRSFGTPRLVRLARPMCATYSAPPPMDRARRPSPLLVTLAIACSAPPETTRAPVPAGSEGPPRRISRFEFGQLPMEDPFHGDLRGFKPSLLAFSDWVSRRWLVLDGPPIAPRTDIVYTSPQGGRCTQGQVPFRAGLLNVDRLCLEPASTVACASMPVCAVRDMVGPRLVFAKSPEGSYWQVANGDLKCPPPPPGWSTVALFTSSPPTLDGGRGEGFPALASCVDTPHQG